MAQSSPNNLKVDLFVDSSGAKVQLREFQAYVSKFAKDLRDAIKSGNEAAIAEARANLLSVTRGLEQASAVSKKFTATTKESTAAHHAHNASIREGARSLAELAREAGFTIEGMKALKFGFAGLGVALLVRQFNEAIAKINELNNAAKEIGGAGGGDPEGLERLRRSMGRTAQATTLADEMIQRFNKSFDQAALKQMQDLGGTSGVNVLAGQIDNAANSLQDFQIVARGGVMPKLGDLSDPRYILGRDLNLKDREGEAKALARAILDIKNKTLQNAAAEAQYGHSFSVVEQHLREIVDDSLPKVAKDTEAAVQTQKEYNSLVGQAKEKWDDVSKAIAQVIQWTIVAATKSKTYEDQAKARLESGDVTGELPFAGPRVPPQIPSGETGASAVLPPQQTGGYVSGPGSGTSDSILARLSNGEFVINAASARRLGGAFLQRLNRYASGGNVTGLDYDPSVTDFTGGAPDYRADRRQLSIHERRVLTDAYNKWRAGPGGRLLNVLSAAGAGETDAEYFKRTGFHYGPRPGEKPLASGRDYARETPLASGRDYARETPLRVDPRGTPLGGSGPSDDAAFRSWGMTPDKMERGRKWSRILKQAIEHGIDPNTIPGLFSGGLVMPPIGVPPISFAKGGLVGGPATAAGTPIHLHIGGGVFPVSANSGVAAALVVEAKHSQMVSSGIKPSWYGR
jgi:hypothetical protein